MILLHIPMVRTRFGGALILNSLVFLSKYNRGENVASGGQNRGLASSFWGW